MAIVETAPTDTTADRAPPSIDVPFLGGRGGVAQPLFAGATVTDPTAGATDTLTISVGNAMGAPGYSGVGATISGDGLTQVNASTYTLTGTADQVTAELDALSVTPANAAGAVTRSATTQITFSVESDFAATNPVYASTTALLHEVPCYAAGTRIATTRGEVLVEDLRAGDVALLATGGTAPIVWVGHRRVRNADPVRVVAGAFGAGLPARDLVLSPGARAVPRRTPDPRARAGGRRVRGPGGVGARDLLPRRARPPRRAAGRGVCRPRATWTRATEHRSRMARWSACKSILDAVARWPRYAHHLR